MVINNLRITKVTVIVFCLTLLSGIGLVSAQDSMIRYALTDDGVYLYHVDNQPLTHGWNLYAKRDGEEDFSRLNEEIIRGAVYPEEFAGMVGELYQELADAVRGNTISETFIRFRSNRVLANLYTFVDPDIARALGRLFVDTTHGEGDTVSYKIEFVNDLGIPTGRELTETFTLRRFDIAQPQITDVSNTGYGVNVEWSYPVMGPVDDKVIRFEVLYRPEGFTGFVAAHDLIVLREDERSSYRLTFTADEMNQNIEIVVRAVDITGNTGPDSETVEYFIVDNISPTVITGVETFIEENEIIVSWPVSPELDLEGYFVYRSRTIDDGYVRLNEVPLPVLETVFRDGDVQEGAQYFYKVSAIDRNGNESALSSAAMRRVPDRTPPSAPETLSAEFLENGEVELVWTMSDIPSDFSRYIILRKVPGDEAYTQIGGDAFRNTRISDPGPASIGFQEGQFYRYAVMATDSSRNVSDTTFTLIQIPDLTPPDPPAVIYVEGRGVELVNVSWDESPSGDVISYRLYRAEQEGSFEPLIEQQRRVRRFRDETVQPGLQYRYAVSAVDSSGNVGEMKISEPFHVRSYDPPRRVRNVQVLTVDRQILVTWEPVVSDFLTGYRVYRSVIANGVFEPVFEGSIEDTEWSGELTEQRFWYRVKAIDTFGNESRPSEPVRAR
jgi:fibronectin type 3 domain-containing protein